MHPPTKDQTDIGVDNPTIDCSNDKDMARQEFKNEADIAYMLSKFGVIAPRGTPTYGEWDDTIDLMTAISSVNDAKEAYLKLPEELRAKFTSMEQLLDAVSNGSLVLKDEEAPVEPPSELETLRTQVAELQKNVNIAPSPTGATT